MPTHKEMAALFQATKTAFEQSVIKRYAEDRNLQWNYSIVSTQLTQNATVIVGFNWGVEDKKKYGPQIEIPKDTFKELYDKKWLGSLERIYQPFKQYLPEEDIDHFVQTNFCFFRSKKENQIKSEDLALSTPLFNRLIELITPKRIIGFFHLLRKHLINNNLLIQLEENRIPDSKKTVYAIKGRYRIEGLRIPCFVLPHLGAHISGEARTKAWEFCFA